MADSEIIKYEGRRFVRTGEFREPHPCEWFISEPEGDPLMASGNVRFGDRRILRELPAETPAPALYGHQTGCIRINVSYSGKDCPECKPAETPAPTTEISAKTVGQLVDVMLAKECPTIDKLAARQEVLIRFAALESLLEVDEAALNSIVTLDLNIDALYPSAVSKFVKDSQTFKDAQTVLARIRASKGEGK